MSKFYLDNEKNCSITTLHNFGGPKMSAYTGTSCYDEYDNPYNFKDLESFKEKCRDAVSEWDSEYYHYRNYRIADNALVIASTSSLQVKAEECLTALGFHRSPLYTSKKFKGISSATVWTISCPDFLKAIDYKE